MAVPTFALPEILAMLETSGASKTTVKNFQQQADFVLKSREPLTQSDNSFEVGSGWSPTSGKGHVRFKTGTVEHQLSPEKAKQIAIWLIEAASVAISDEVVMQLMRERAGVTDERKLGAILLDLREIRQGSRGTVNPS